MTDISRPRYHRFSWKPTITGSVTVAQGINSAVIDLATDIGSSYWGWAENGSHVASPTESIQGRLGVLIEAVIDVWAVASVAVSYTWPDGNQGVPVTRYIIVVPGADVSLTFSSAAVALQFGFDGAGPHTTSSGVVTADFHDAGHWGPRVLGGYDEPWTSNPNIGKAENLDGSARRLYVWGATLTAREMMFPTVYVADIRADAAATTSYATAAGRVIADTNSTLAALLEAARTPTATNEAPAFRVYTTPGVYTTCYLLEGLEALKGLCSDASVRRVWRVEMTWAQR